MSHPFGMLQPNRHKDSKSYRYGFQGQEKDDEIKGEGNSVNYKYRMHDARLGRFFAVDPLAGKYPWNSPYAFSENKVTVHVELEGLEAVFWEFKYDNDGTRIGVTEARRIESNTDKYVSLYLIKNTDGNWHIVPNDYNKSLLLTSTDVISTWQDGNASYQKAIDVHNMGVIGDYAATIFYTFATAPIRFGNVKAPTINRSASVTKGAARISKIESELANETRRINKKADLDCDCTNIAKDLSNLDGGKGKILQITTSEGNGGLTGYQLNGKNTKTFKGNEYGNSETFSLHEIYVKEGQVYDPMMSPNPIPLKTYKKIYQDLNSTVKLDYTQQ
ncbi:RHS repeat-associated core domain-containing protein [Tamlana sp. 2_MG-2023]|uniref:RHS repeat-associated core domain-containing protein n=1 Tax=unclassified Tamlana TaxID=2614803 RepID=UPI0026E1379C|nr:MULTISPECIES: RHS repeat-associated core domain-containing protein [unclassified Tamlana]MDO6761837.1 RHS repeat-associated core domain-containing protein [Tamlana sp. 2_MG-2023]MDO6792618.1 RHS repeat-associated core domain-containing protein [Tamlana sp. 1_MG-2023]